MNSDFKSSETYFLSKLSNPRQSLKKELENLEQTLGKVRDPIAKQKIQLQIYNLKKRAGMI